MVTARALAHPALGKQPGTGGLGPTGGAAPGSCLDMEALSRERQASKGPESDATFLTFAAACFWALALLARFGAILAVFPHPAVRRRRARRLDRPPVSVIVPVAQEEPEAEAAFASLFGQAYPGFEVLVTSAPGNAEAVGPARRVASRFPHVPTRFLAGNPRRTLNPKISNIEPAVEAAAHDLLLIKDSNVTLPPGHLTEMVRCLTPGVGMVCTLPVSVHPGSLAAEIECAMTNAHAAPWLLGGSFIGLNIGFGKVMLIDRRDLARAGGLEVMASTFGDDHALAKGLGRLGLRTVFSGGAVRRVMGRRTLREVWDRQLRWMLIRRRESPLAFLAEPLFCAATASMAGALAAPVLGMPGWVVGLATAAAWLVGDFIVVAGRGWGFSWRFPLAVVCREALIYALWLRSWSTRTVSWAGERLDVGIPPGKAGSDGDVRREVAEVGSSWTTTAIGEVPPEVPLRDDVAPAPSREKVVERGRFRPDRSLREVGSATLTAFLPPRGLASGVAAIVCPGGGYAAVTIDREGYEVGRWLASRGIAGLVLKYRIPPLRAPVEDPPRPLQDITRALAVARLQAGAWGFDERRVGVVGFSAGGHMAAHAAATDPHLAFAAMVYPVISMDPRITHRGSRRRILGPRPPGAMIERYSFEHRVVAGSAPTFLVHAADDDVVPIENSHRYADALRSAGVPHECLFVPQGGHGFGLGLAGTGAALWPERFMEWLGVVGILSPQ